MEGSLLHHLHRPKIGAMDHVEEKERSDDNHEPSRDKWPVGCALFGLNPPIVQRLRFRRIALPTVAVIADRVGALGAGIAVVTEAGCGNRRGAAFAGECVHYVVCLLGFGEEVGAGRSRGGPAVEVYLCLFFLRCGMILPTRVAYRLDIQRDRMARAHLEIIPA